MCHKKIIDTKTEFRTAVSINQRHLNSISCISSSRFEHRVKSINNHTIYELIYRVCLYVCVGCTYWYFVLLPVNILLTSLTRNRRCRWVLCKFSWQQQLKIQFCSSWCSYGMWHTFSQQYSGLDNNNRCLFVYLASNKIVVELREVWLSAENKDQIDYHIRNNFLWKQPSRAFYVYTFSF